MIFDSKPELLMVGSDPAEASQWSTGPKARCCTAAVDSNFPHKNTGLVYPLHFNVTLL